MFLLEFAMRYLGKILSMMIMGSIFFINVNGDAVSVTASARSLFEKAQEEIYRLDFEKAYEILSEMTKKHPDSAYREKVIILKNIISLAQTFSNLRLYSAYHQGCSLYEDEEEKTAAPLSPLSLLKPYRSEYLKRTKKWALRLEPDKQESLKVPKEIELSFKYPGSEDLPYFVKTGLDTIENIKKGIPPTPSQAQNIEEYENYAAVLSVFFLCALETYEVPQKTSLIKGKVIPGLLISYSRLWLKKVLEIFGAKVT